MSLTADQRARLEALAFPLTDYGNAERLVAMHGDDIRHASGIGWLVWDGRRFAPDDLGELLRRAKSTARAIYHDAANCEDDDERKRIGAWARTSESEPRLRAMVSLAASEESVAIRAADLDADPFLLNVLNGTVDLRTGELQSHNRGDLITRLAPVTYDPGAESERWESFLRRVTGADAELSAFVQRLAGYTIAGVTDEEILAFLHGPGATGKTTAVEAIKATLGEYASTSDFETFLARRGDAGIRNDVARLAGARMVVSVEVEDGKRLAEGLIKQLTGGDKIAARFLHREVLRVRAAVHALARREHPPSSPRQRRRALAPHPPSAVHRGHPGRRTRPRAETRPSHRPDRADGNPRVARPRMPRMAAPRASRAGPCPQLHRRVPARERPASRMDRR